MLYERGRGGGGSHAAVATGHAVFLVALAGAGIVTAALVALPRGGGRLAPAPGQTVAPRSSERVAAPVAG